jgi:glycosyltransferase involved in cell wall biosynthesis
MNNPLYNLVLQDRNWVMEKLAIHFDKYLPNSKISDSADLNADINFYFNWHGMRRKTRFDVCFFTHIENRKHWEATANVCDVAVLMGGKYDNTVPEDKKLFFYPPPFESFLPQKPIRVLVVGRSYSSGRKNFEAAELVGNLENVDLKFTEGRLSEDELKQAYLDTDYVLVTSKIEAGPMCVVEALAMNKPVIAPDVGWCWEFPVIRYDNETDLKSIFEKLSFENNIWENKINNLYNKIQRLHENQ